MDAYGSAQGTVESLLSSLTLVLRDKAQLLPNVRRDLQCISGEMESMNGFLLDLNEASEDDDHQLHAWKKQVREVAVESERWVQQHHRWAAAAPRGGRGLLGYLRRIQHLVQMVPERRDMAIKIQELKVRTHEVGERGQRYGIDVPSIEERRTHGELGPGVETEEDQFVRRRLLVHPVEPYITEEDNKNMISWLTEEGAEIPQVRVIQVVGMGKLGKNSLGKLYYQDSIRTRFNLKVWITLPAGAHSLIRMLEQLVLTMQKQAGVRQDVLHVMDKVTRLLKNKKFLITFDGINNASTWQMLCSTLSKIAGTDGSALVGITQDFGSLRFSSGRTLNKVVNPSSMYQVRATRLLKTASGEDEKRKVLCDIVVKLFPDLFCCKMLLHLLYVNPNRTLEQLQSWCRRLYTNGGWNNTRHMLLFCYKDLSKDHRSCLLYLAIFPMGQRIRRVCLVRRWVSEGLIARRAGISALEAAELCFNALLDRGLLICVDSSACGKAKFIQIPYSVTRFIVERDIAENSANLNLPPNFAPFLSPGNGIQLQQIPKECRPKGNCSRLWPSIGCNCKHGVPAVEPDVRRDIVWLLGVLPMLDRQGFIKVLVLESCKGVEKHHLKNISQISELRYLNLRGTDITKLPEDIHRLYNLETLDIRQTKVPTPILGMPIGIGHMTEMQVLSHVQISADNFDKLIPDLEQLQKLRKFGVVLHGEMVPHLHKLLHAIEKLGRCLQSLSICFKPEASGYNADNRINAITLPMFLQSIKLTGLKDGLPSCVLRLSQLVKVTLRECFLKNSDLWVLSQLANLSTLCMMFIRSCENINHLVLQRYEYRNLKFLVLKQTFIQQISIQEGSAPRLEKLIWTNSTVNTLSGMNHLWRLADIIFTGSVVSDGVKQAIALDPRPINVVY
ncbi:hypothetical protein ACQ4PT_010684 [Festuca glaucescens]